MNNLNEGEFACSINNLYTLNQDENIGILNFKAQSLDGAINLIIVKGE